jgi:adenylosuccinate synthase
MPATRWSSATRPTSCRCCRRASCAASSGIIGNGVVLDPEWLLHEIAKVTAQGLSVTPENRRIAENVP